MPLPQDVSGKDFLHSLELYVKELRGLKRGSAERLHAFQHVFSMLIKNLPAHGPLLAEVKREYEQTMEALLQRDPATEPLPEGWRGGRPR